MSIKKILIFTLLYFIPLSIEAKIFKNSYISLDLPTNWNCFAQDTEWVCHEKNKKKNNEAIVVIVAKQKGLKDHLRHYTSHLKKPKSIRTKSGMKKSKVNYVRKVKIAQHEWVDGMHLTSEADSYFTRYLATVTPHLGILVTFTVHKKAYSKYSKIFSKAVNSLKVNQLSQGHSLMAKNYNVNLPPSRRHQKRNFLDSEDSTGLDDSESLNSRSSHLNKDLLYKILGGLLLLGGLLFFVFKMRKN